MQIILGQKTILTFEQRREIEKRFPGIVINEHEGGISNNPTHDRNTIVSANPVIGEQISNFLHQVLYE